MSTTVKINNQPSNRAKGGKQGGDRKIVYKSVLDNPFRVQWPEVPINVQNSLLAKLFLLLDGVAEYQSQRSARNRAAKRHKRASRKFSAQEGNAAPDTNIESDQLLDPPAIIQHLSLGINQVTKCLDALNLQRRCKSSDVTSPLHLIFACRADIDPPLLIDHLPHSVAAFNSTKPDLTIKLVTLPKGSEFSLAEATGLRRVAVIGISANAPGLEEIIPLLDSVPTLAASWLIQSFDAQKGNSSALIPTHIKQIRTSAPKDLKAAKTRKAEERKEARKRRKLDTKKAR